MTDGKNLITFWSTDSNIKSHAEKNAEELKNKEMDIKLWFKLKVHFCALRKFHFKLNKRLHIILGTLKPTLMNVDKNVSGIFFKPTDVSTRNKQRTAKKPHV